jgi:hypothetical protein
MNYKWDFFIAHASSDRTVAEDLYERLTKDARVFLDSRSLKLGDDWDLVLREAQQNSLVTVVLISRHTDNAYYQREEIAASVALARSGGGHRVVPVYLDKEAAQSDSIPYGLRLKHGITLSDEVDVFNVWESLVTLKSQLQNESETEIELARRRQVSDLVLVVSVEGSTSTPWDSKDTVLSYRVDRSESSVSISPSMPYLDRYHVGGPISDIRYNYMPFEWGFPNLDFRVVNNGHRTIFFTEVCFELTSSRLDPRPVLVIRTDSYRSNALHFSLSNEGWETPQNLRAEFHLVPIGADLEMPANAAYRHKVIIEDFSEATNVNISAAFHDSGVDLEGLRSLQSSHGRLACFQESFESLKGGDWSAPTPATDEFKRLLDCLGAFRRGAGSVKGEFIYDALSLGGVMKERRVKFSTTVYIVDEYLAGAPAPPTFQYAAKFDVDRQKYEVRVPISHVLKPAEADRFTVRIGMDKSSVHSFIAKLLYNDGQQIASPMVNLIGFVPRSGAHYIRDRSGPRFSDDQSE